jgi:hypothetical protein
MEKSWNFGDKDMVPTGPGNLGKSWNLKNSFKAGKSLGI